MGMMMFFMTMFMAVMVIFVVMIVIMFMTMMVVFMIMMVVVMIMIRLVFVVMMLMSLQIDIHTLLFLPMDRHFHMGSGDPALYGRFCLDGEPRQAHLVHGL